jgi:hypothetical protein
MKIMRGTQVSALLIALVAGMGNIQDACSQAGTSPAQGGPSLDETLQFIENSRRNQGPVIFHTTIKETDSSAEGSIETTTVQIDATDVTTKRRPCTLDISASVTFSSKSNIWVGDTKSTDSYGPQTNQYRVSFDFSRIKRVNVLYEWSMVNAYADGNSSARAIASLGDYLFFAGPRAANAYPTELTCA